ncbi:hypothetical protein LOTGIDRAFT_152664 [Lottia gigantea]|uniref:Uncharacterized protein n=1 Tax=Lottia gigantea TaxID=225164 RepID=V4C7B1_LOTGI|nr:hypothetical protein LOTGIDRAFT_152664 [Lottia gigantea]ESO97574.1 hypothetical protein LOTGIDRAFT_152664 [Lottia gigantea]
MGDTPGQGNNQTTTDQSASHPGDDGNGKDNQETIASLRSKKRVCKSQLTKSKLLLTSLLCASEKRAEQVRNAVDAILRHQETAIDIHNCLCDENPEPSTNESTVVEQRSRVTVAPPQIGQNPPPEPESITPDHVQRDQQTSQSTEEAPDQVSNFTNLIETCIGN